MATIFKIIQQSIGSGIIIDHTKIDENLTDFQVGVTLDSTNAIWFVSQMTSDNWKNLHATVDNEECYVEIDVWDSTNQIAVFWVMVPTVSSLTDTFISLEFGSNNYTRAISSPEVIDSFTGTNGDDPNPYLWTKTIQIGSDYLTIQSNTLYFNSPGDDANHINYIDSKNIISGDFDTQIDWVNNTENWPTDNVNYCPSLRIIRKDNDITIATINVVINNASGNAYSRSGTDQAYTDWSRSYSEGKLRAYRVNGLIKVQYYENGSWQTEYTVCNNDNSDIYVRIYFEQENNAVVQSAIDNFTINSCDGITMYVGETSEAAAEVPWKDYNGVFHLTQDPTTSVLDSSPNRYDLTGTVAMTSGDLVNQKFGKGIEFGVDDAYLYRASAVQFNGDFSLGIRFYLNSWPSASSWATIFHQGDYTVSDNQGMTGFISSTGRFTLYWLDGASWGGISFVTVMNPGEYHSLSVSFNSVAYGDTYGTIDGVTEHFNSSREFVDYSSYPFHLGAAKDTTYIREFDGIIDEIFFINELKGESWTKAMYYNLNNSLTTISS